MSRSIYLHWVIIKRLGSRNPMGTMDFIYTKVTLCAPLKKVTFLSKSTHFVTLYHILSVV